MNDRKGWAALFFITFLVSHIPKTFSKISKFSIENLPVVKRAGAAVNGEMVIGFFRDF